MDEWKIERRKRQCTPCEREFESEEVHYSGIVTLEKGFERRDLCLPCWEKKPFELFSYWKTRMPRREERKLEDIAAMVEFFKCLAAAPGEDPTRRKVTYLTALLLMRKKRLKIVGHREETLILEKAWDGETIEIVEPTVGEEELDALRVDMEKLFDLSFA